MHNLAATDHWAMLPRLPRHTFEPMPDWTPSIDQAAVELDTNLHDCTHCKNPIRYLQLTTPAKSVYIEYALLSSLPLLSSLSPLPLLSSSSVSSLSLVTPSSTWLTISMPRNHRVARLHCRAALPVKTFVCIFARVPSNACLNFVQKVLFMSAINIKMPAYRPCRGKSYEISSEEVAIE